MLSQCSTILPSRTRMMSTYCRLTCLPVVGIPAALTVVLSEDGVPVYLAKNLFDLGSFDLVVDQLGSA